MAANIDQLIALARSILKEQEACGEDLSEGEEEPPASTVDELIDRVEGYAEDFSVWFEAHKEYFLEKEASGLEPQMKELLELHKRVLFVAEKLLTDTSQERKALKKRGKGIMAYLDVLPRRVSITGKREG
jgi:hypothetical protein